MKESKECWSTEREIKFIDNLGKHRIDGSRFVTHAEALMMYLKSAKRRVDWGTVDSNRVMAHAMYRLASYDPKKG